MTKTAKKSVKPLRSYYYGYGKDDVINAYTPQEGGPWRVIGLQF